MLDDWDQEKTEILAANTAQGVYRHLRALESNRARVLPRWVWELLQNARDVARGPSSLDATVELTEGHLTFCHNGRPFQRQEITHLIYYGSTKLEQDATLGQFGSGFLTTHLLSPAIEISSHLDDGRVFAFRLDRSGETVLDLQRYMDDSWEAFKASLRSSCEPPDQLALTKFQYPIDQRAMDAVDEGIGALTRNGPYVMVFNPEFNCVRIQTADGEKVLELGSRHMLAEHTAEVQIAVSGQAAEESVTCRYLVSELEGVAVAVPFVRENENVRLEPPADTPKLLLGFPLIGTEDFSFPAVIHSSRFNPTEERDGVFLGQNDDDPANLENVAVLRKASHLLLMTLALAAKSGWENASVLAHIPPVPAYPWLNEHWLRDQLRTLLVDPIRATPAVVTETGRAIAPTHATLPIATEPQSVERLWDLAAAIPELADTLPRSSEAWGWCDAVESWAAVCQCSAGDFDETIDGSSLAQQAEQAETLDGLQKLLAGEAAPADWLNGLHRFLAENNFGELLRTLCIVPDQTGRFRKLSELHRDREIPDRLKDIAPHVGWDLRAELRDCRFSVLADEAGAGDLDRDDAVQSLIRRLHTRMEKELDDASKKASVSLFGWIVEHEEWSFLRGYPAFSDEGSKSVLIRLNHHSDDDEKRPLAPVSAWPSDLSPYAELFPRRHTLAAEFADAVSDQAAWAILEESTFLRRTVLYSHSFALRDFLPSEPLAEDDNGVEHKVKEPVTVTKVAFLTKSDVSVLNRVRQSRSQAQLFWSFLTQWLVEQDKHAFEATSSRCVCGFDHDYFPADWLVSIVRNQWVPLEGRRTDRANAHSLANLIRDSNWPKDLLSGSPQVVALLCALRVSVPELIMALEATNEEERSSFDRALSSLLTVVGSEWRRLGDLADDIQDDEQLLDHLAERRERRRMKRENRRSGELVETLVKQALEDQGFSVQGTGIGSDFTIELTRAGRSWLVEVKSTRSDRVWMTETQARTAVKRSQEFLLCVVPLGCNPGDPDLEQVRACARFVDGIGCRLTSICTSLDRLEGLRASVTTGDAEDLCLEVESGSPRVRVDAAVWRGGITLDKLLGALGHASTG